MDQMALNHNYQVNIFGPKSLQNELMARFITQEAGVSCQCCQEKDIVQVIKERKDKNVLILWDCLNRGVSNVWNELSNHFSNNGLKCKVERN